MHAGNHWDRQRAELHMRTQKRLKKAVFVLGATLLFGFAQPPTFDQSRQEVIRNTMLPYRGPRTAADRSTLTGKVMCGYQGWFAAEGDGSKMGWFHWGEKSGIRPGTAKVEMWPDVSELDPDELYPTDFRFANGERAQLFSSYNRKTVLRHFKWMRDYGIDGVFVQRFATRIQRPVDLNFTNTVLSHCREGANTYGRSFAIMYDLSSLQPGGTQVVIDDWKLLRDKMRLTNDRAYLHHEGKPVVAVWGIGFNDGRAYTLEECKRLIKFLKRDRNYGGATVMIGVPTYWRTLNGDCVNDPLVLDIVNLADIVSPWTIGRFNTTADIRNYAKDRVSKDLSWCSRAGKELMPVAYPGFSWANLNPGTPSDRIPRVGGRFLWTQYSEYAQAGATMVYQAMFDEVDEGTAIFKVTNDPPLGQKFLTFDGPSDTYLWLVGQATKMIRGEVRVRHSMPVRR